MVNFATNRISSIAVNSTSKTLEKALNYAQNISKLSNVSDDALVNDIIGLKDCELQIKANAKLIKIEEKMHRCILDIFA
ncbi:MAG: hypothetical protein ACOX3T_08505 [Bdellovibrionota bacterium]